MTGPEHYREAERLLEEASVPARDRAVAGWLTADELVAAAQVHATLALAAATVDAAAMDRARSPIDASGYVTTYTEIPSVWREVLS